MTGHALTPESTPDADDRRLAAAERAGAAGRRLLNALIASRAPAELLDATADQLDRAAASLEPHAATSRYDAIGSLSVDRLPHVEVGE